MEHLLHYIWKHKLLPLRPLVTTDGRTVEVLNPGLHNTNAGPDFTGAKVKIDGIEWVGNVEIHLRTSDWFRHHHDTDATYDNIILHVVEHADQQLLYPDGAEVPQLEIEVPLHVRSNFSSLMASDHTPRCSEVVSNMPTFTVHNWLTSLALERFEERTKQIMQRRDELNKNWEDVLFVTLARSYGFGINGDAFEAWSRSIPMSAVGKHRDSLFQIEAIFFGQAGLLEDPANLPVPARMQQGSGEPQMGEDGKLYDDYYLKLCREYKYLRHKFTLTPISPMKWRFLRLRPQNFPHVRIAQLAMLYYEQHLNLSRLISADEMDATKALLQTHVSDYWRTHYTFNSEPSRESDKKLSDASLNLLIINSVAPILFAYGKYRSMPQLCDRAFDFWQSIKPETNHITRAWADAGVKCESAADSQALIQLHRNYCEPHNCLRCKFGYEFIRNTPSMLCEGETTR